MRDAVPSNNLFDVLFAFTVKTHMSNPASLVLFSSDLTQHLPRVNWLIKQLALNSSSVFWKITVCARACVEAGPL